jgi:hypothetical protein
MSINSQNTYLNIEDAHLRLRTGNVYAQGINIGGITVDTAHGLQRVSDTGNVTSNTLQFANATTAFVTTANVTVGRDLTVTGNATVSSNLTVTGNTLISDDLTVTENLLVSNNLTVTGNLNVTGNTFYTNPAAVLVDSNVVTEYTGPHDRPPRKYPEVAMTANDNSSTSGYVADQTAFSGNADGYAYRLFDHSLSTAYQSGGSQYSSGDSTGSAQTTTATDGTTHQGVAITLDLATKIRLSYAKITSHTYYGRTPVEGTFLGSNNNSTWDVIGTFSGLSTTAAGQTHTVHISDYATKSAYRYIRLVVTKIHTSAVQNGGTLLEFRELEYYGHEEGSGSLDTTLKSVYNVPATTGTQLEVYYDAKDLTEMPSTVTDLSPNTNTGALSTSPPTLDTTDGIESFKFDASSSQRITSTIDTSYWGTNKLHSVSFWLKADTVGGKFNIFQIGNAAANEVSAFWISDGSADSNGGNSLNWWSYGGDSTLKTSSFSWALDTWYHIALTFDGSTKKLYVNGKYIEFSVNNTVPTANLPTGIPASASLLVGSSSVGGGGDYFDGSIANFRVYGAKVLNAGQVQELYDYQKDYFLGSKSQVTLYKGHLGVGVTEPSGQLELAGDERIQEYPPGPMSGYETLIPGHGVFCASSSDEFDTAGTYSPWKAFTKNTTSYFITDHVPTSYNSDGTPTGISRFEGVLGSWLKLKLPYDILLKRINLARRADHAEYFSTAILYGSVDDTSWDVLHNIQMPTSYTNVDFEINATKVYKYFVIQITKGAGLTYLNIGEWRLFGTPGPTTLDKGSLTLGRSLDVPRISRYDVDTETPRPEKLVVDFDTTVNSSPTDISGQGNHGVFYGTNMKYSSADKAFVFNGTDDYIETSINIGSGGNIPICISVWVKYNADGWWFWLGDETTPGGIGVESRSSGTRIRFVVRSGNYVEINSPGYNMWNHYTFIHTGSTTSDGRMDIYMNGVFIEPVDSRFNYATTNITNNNLRVGDRSSSPNFNGQISNFKMYGVGTILEPSEVKKLYNLGRTGRSMVISDTAVGIGKVPEAQLDVRGILKASVGLFPDKPFFACEAYRYGLKDNDTTQTLYWHGGDTATLSSVGNMAGSRWKLGVLSGNHTYKTNNVQLVRVLNDSSSETSGVRVPYDGYYHLMHINRTISFNVGSSFVIYSPRHQKYIQTSMNGYRVPWGGNNPSGAAGGTNSNSVHASLYLEAGDIVIYIFHNAVIADNFLSGSYEQFVSLVML